MSPKAIKPESDKTDRIQGLIGVNDEESLRLAKEVWLPKRNKSPLDSEALKTLSLIGSLLHERGEDNEALGYLSRFHNELPKGGVEPSDDSILLEWGDLLFESVSESVKAELKVKYGDADNCEDLVQEEWLRLAATQDPVSAPSKTVAKAAGASGGCVVTLVISVLVTAGALAAARYLIS